MNNIIISNKKPIVIGRQGENEVTTIRFAVNALFPHIQNATYGLIHQRHGDVAPYPCVTKAPGVIYDTPDESNSSVPSFGGYIDWVVNSADLGKAGSGTAQLTAYKDGAVAKSIIFTTITLTSMGTTDAPDPVQLYIDRIVRAGQEAVNAAADAEESAEEAEASKEAAAGSADQAAQSASDAAASAEAAAASASDAATSATQAGLRANSAEAARNQAMTYANNAYNSATQAGTSAQSAAQARIAAQSAASAAQQILDGTPDTIEAELAAAKLSGEYAVNILGNYTVEIYNMRFSSGTNAWAVDGSDVPGAHVGDWIVGAWNLYGLAMFKVVGFDGGNPYGTDLVILRRDAVPTKISDLVNDVGNTVWGGTGALFSAGTVTEQGGQIIGYSFSRTYFPKAVVHDLILGAEPLYGFAAIFRITSITSTEVICEAPALQVSGPTIPAGGTTGQVLRKKSNEPYAVEWATI